MLVLTNDKVLRFVMLMIPGTAGFPEETYTA